MFLCCDSLCLLVVLGVALASGSPVHFVSENLKQTHESIADVLKLKEYEVARNPLFSSVINSMNTSCQTKVHLMNVTLNIYAQIFSSILQQDEHHDSTQTSGLLTQLSVRERSNVESSLTELQQKMEKLKGHLNEVYHDREAVLAKLNKIEVSDTLVQKKALAQYGEVYHVASLIGSRCGPIHSSSAE
uniref:Uncharacterized protein n=1 Tax=Sander lucioperca TaxID=283035 RepID=A0A8C9Y9Y3_SANLU